MANLLVWRVAQNIAIRKLKKERVELPHLPIKINL